VIIIACRRNLSKYEEGNFDVIAAKEWYYGVFKKTNAFSKVDFSSPFAPVFGSSNFALAKYPDWGNAISYTNNGIEYVEMPLVYNTKTIILPDMEGLSKEEKKRIGNTSLTRVLFAKKADGQIVVRTVTIIPTLEYAKQYNYDISLNTLNHYDARFGGFVIVKTWDEKIIKAGKYDNGKIKRRMQLSRLKVNSISVANTFSQPTNRTLYNQECDWVWIPQIFRTCVIVPEGDNPSVNEDDCDNWHEVESPVYGTWDYVCRDIPDEQTGCDYSLEVSCECQLYGIGCGDDNGDGNESEPYMTIEVDDDLENPCLKNAKNAITDNSCKTLLTSLFQSTFVGQGSSANLWFHEGGCMQGGISTLGCTNYIPSSNTYEITLNPNEISGASREYIGSAILHEIVHAFILQQNPAIGSYNDAAHREIVAGWVNNMAELLHQSFGISLEDAKALALNGTGDALKGDGVMSTSEWNAFLQDKYGLTPNQVSSIAQDYHDKTNGKGSNCQ
jgi:hypothetical protein